jgi:hypothetical protein
MACVKRMSGWPPRDSALELATRTPRCAYVSGIIALLLILMVVVAHLTGHGLGGH